jgi:hypothetical protein
MEEYQGMLEAMLGEESLAADQRELLEQLMEYGDSLLA